MEQAEADEGRANGMAERDEILAALDPAADTERLRDALNSLPCAWREISARSSAFDVLPGGTGTYGAVVLAPARDAVAVQRLVDSLYEQSGLPDLPLVLFGERALHARTADVRAPGPLFRLGPESPRQLIASVIAAAHQSYAQRMDLMNELDSRTSAIGLIVSGKFRLQTIKQAEHLTTMLALASPDSKLTAFVLLELLINAIEHGNLGIGHEEKGALLEQGIWTETVEARQTDPANIHKWVTVTFNRHRDFVRFEVEDQGEGFDWRSYLDPNRGAALDSTALKGSALHGRGITLASGMDGATLTYQGRGNVAVLTLDTPPSPSGPSFSGSSPSD